LGSGAAAAATTTTLASTTITASGVVSVDDTTTSTSGTTGSIHTDGGLGVAGTAFVAGAATVGGASQFNSTVTVGVDGTGYDVTFFGATSGRYMLWDESADALLLPDNVKEVWGTGGDFSIFHDGSNTYLTETGSATGNVYFRANNLVLSNNSNEPYLVGASDGAVTLYHNNVSSFFTRSDGITVPGASASSTIEVGTGRTGNGYAWLDLVGDETYSDYGLRLIRYNSGANAGSDLYHRGTGSLRLFADEAAPIVFSTDSTERMRIDAVGAVGIGTAPNGGYITGNKLEVNSGTLGTTATNISSAQLSTAATGNLVTLQSFAYRTANGSDHSTAEWRTQRVVDATRHSYIGYGSTYLSFGTNATEQVRMNSSGDFMVGITSNNPVASRANGSALGANGSLRSRTATGQNYFGLSVTSGVNLYFYTDNGSAFVTGGNIATNGGTTSYNGTSDYRLKDNIQPLTDALSRVALLQPVKWTWKKELGGTESNGEGFVAHELAEILPMAVTGEKDAVDAEGKPEYQGVDPRFLVATLTAAMQEQQVIIEALTTRITALEG